MTAPDPFTIAADILDPPLRPVSPWHHDPVAFVHDCIDWTGLDGPTTYQQQLLAALVDDLNRTSLRKVAERGPHGLGKTAGNAWTVHWFAVTSELAAVEWKAPTTASAWRQLTHFLWPEIRKWARRIRWDVIADWCTSNDLPVRGPYGRFELLQQNLKLDHGEAFAVACDDPATIEGAHADRLLFIYDEAKTIPAATFDATEGAFAQAGADNGHDIEAFAVATSTPGDPAGRFYDICRRTPGLEDWHPLHVTLDDTIAAGRVSREWAEQRARQWGAKSAVYLNRVEGEFAASDEDSVIPLAWVEQANQRWLDLAGDHDVPQDLGGLDVVGVDVARSGTDSTVMALRHGWTVAEIRYSELEDTMQTTGRVAGILDAKGGEAVVDVIGIGSGVVDRLRELGHRTVGFNAGEGTDLVDSSGELGFARKRSAAWWHMREILDPASGCPVALPPDDLLTGDLTAPKWRVTSTGRIQVESKDEIRKRLGRSTDSADAVIQSFWPEREPEFGGELVEAEDVWGDEMVVRISPV